MEHRKFAILAAVALLAASAVRAQEKKKPQMPKPGEEVKKLAYFAGTWKTEGDVKENPVMPAGKLNSTDRCEWFQGGFFLVCRSTGTGPMGATRGMGFLGYSKEEKVYTYSGIDSMGLASQGKGRVEGSTWTYESESKMGGESTYGRYVINQVSPVSYTFRCEMSPDGKAWSTVVEGRSEKEGPAGAPPAKK